MERKSMLKENEKKNIERENMFMILNYTINVLHYLIMWHPF
jgi:hypothetical protein